MKTEYVAMIEFDGAQGLERRIKQTQKALKSEPVRKQMYATSWQGGLPTNTVDISEYSGKDEHGEDFTSLAFIITGYVSRKHLYDLDDIFKDLDKDIGNVPRARAVTIHRITATDVPYSKELLTEHSPHERFRERLDELAAKVKFQ